MFSIGDVFTWLLAKLLLFTAFILQFLPALPEFPTALTDKLNTFFDLIFDLGSGLLFLFIDPVVLKIVIPLLIVTIYLDKIYKCVMWILKKIPFLDIK